MKTRMVFLAFVCAALLNPLGAQEAPESGAPAFRAPREEDRWAMHLKAKDAFSRREYGESLAVIKRAVSTFGEYPEADVLIARIYEIEGDFELAERHYNRALERHRQFQILEERYAVLYRLAELARLRGRYRDYESRLIEIVHDHREYRDQRFSAMRENMVKLLTDFGIDRMLARYRFRGDAFMSAHVKLGEFYCLTGRYPQALTHLTLAAVLGVSILAAELREADPDYRFTTLTDLLDRAQRFPHMRRFVQESDLFRGLYYLAASLLPGRHWAVAAHIWKNLVQFASGEWKERSMSQLRRPTIEPLMVDVERR